MRRATRSAEERAARLAARSTGPGSRFVAAEGINAVTGAIGRYRQGGRAVTSAEAAWLTVVLGSLRVRDDAWARTRQQRLYEQRPAAGARASIRRRPCRRYGPRKRAAEGQPVTARLDYQWHLRQAMAAQGMFSTTDLIEPLTQRGITLSTSQVYRLVVERPERLSLKILMALLDILNCTMDDLIEPVPAADTPAARKRAAGGGGVGQHRPLRAQIAPLGQ